jgi:hypothetical protein
MLSRRMLGLDGKPECGLRVGKQKKSARRRVSKARLGARTGEPRQGEGSRYGLGLGSLEVLFAPGAVRPKRSNIEWPGFV